MSPVVDRLAELRRHLDHLRELRPRVTGAEILRRDFAEAVRRIEESAAG